MRLLSADEIRSKVELVTLGNIRSVAIQGVAEALADLVVQEPDPVAYEAAIRLIEMKIAKKDAT